MCVSVCVSVGALTQRGGAVAIAWDTNNQIPKHPIPRNNLWILGGASKYNEAEQDSWISFEF